MKSTEDKFSTVISKNTFYFFNPEFEEKYEGHINSLKETLLIVKNKIETDGLKKDIFEWLLKEKENGLKALLTLTGFSKENFVRLITILRIIDNPELNSLVHKSKWCKESNSNNLSEWSIESVSKLIKSNDYFRKGVVNVFFEGATIPYLANTLPLFELKKLSISKLNFEVPALIDTIIRYKEKGSRAGKRDNNPEIVISNILEKLKITYETGDLPEFEKHAQDTKRTMDFIIPNKQHPRIIVESSFVSTTSSGMGDKAKTEIAISELIKKYYPRTKFIGFVDGIGWYVRKGDVQRITVAFEDVFTFHKDELQRFETFLIDTFKK
ncbi:MAG: hypothetical protein LBG61_06790 [Burkholderiales bacterium]|jgi:hypothetical protein|nr:hypothetical protein [Burkholderiales bacterium]